jgi:putative transposase
LIRDFKGFTSKKMINLIRDNTQESRKEWLLWMLERAGKKNSNLTKYQFWQQNNHPIEILPSWRERLARELRNKTPAKKQKT